MSKTGRTIAAFDFDGTITARDTFIDFLICNFGTMRFIVGCLRLAPILVMYKLGLIANNVAKERLFCYFFSAMDENAFRSHCETYSLNRIDHITKIACLEQIKWHKDQGHELVIVSASMEDWIRPWASRNLFNRVIATRAEIKQGQLTGRFASENCYAGQKVERFLAEYPEKESYYLYFYRDSVGDAEMVQLADNGSIVRW